MTNCITIYEVFKFNTRKEKKFIQKMLKDLNRPFIKEDTSVSNKCMKRCSASLAIRELETKTTMKYTSTTITKIKILVISSTIEEQPDHCQRQHKMIRHSRKQ